MKKRTERNPGAHCGRGLLAGALLLAGGTLAPALAQAEDAASVNVETVVAESARGMDAAAIIRHIRDAGMPVNLTDGDVARLKEQHVDPQVIEFMQQRQYAENRRLERARFSLPAPDAVNAQPPRGLLFLNRGF